MNRSILAIDLGQFNSVFCWYDPDARVETFRTVPIAPDDLRRLPRPRLGVAVPGRQDTRELMPQG